MMMMMLRVLVGSMTTFIVAASTQTTSLELAFASCDCPEASAAPTAAGDTCTPPNDQLYAHLLGTFVSELKGASISEKELEGYYMVENLPKAQMLDTHITKASTKFREASTKGKCNALTNRGRNPGTFEFLLEVLLAYHAMALDKNSTSSFPVTAAAAANVSHTIDQMCLGVVLGRIIQSGDIKAAESILRENIEAIKPGESFILPSKWHGGTSSAGHAMVLEFEREEDGDIMVRIFNLGAGASFHANAWIGDKHGGDTLMLPFHEFVNIKPSRLSGGAFTNFLVFVNSQGPIFGDEWGSSVMYEQLLAATGGEVSSRSVPKRLLRPPQHLGTCSMESALAVQDKLLGDAGLAERLRLVAMLRATFAYYCKNKHLFAGSNVADDGDARRSLLLKGIDATLEQAERTLEAGGAGGRWGDLKKDGFEGSINRLLALKKVVFDAHCRDTGGIEALIRSASMRNNLAVWSDYLNVKASTKLKKKKMDENSSRSTAVASRAKAVQTLLNRIKNAQEYQDLVGAIDEALSNYSWSATSPDSSEDARIIRMAVLALPQSILEENKEREEEDLTVTLQALQKLQDAHFFHIVQASSSNLDSARLTAAHLQGVLKMYTVLDKIIQLRRQQEDSDTAAEFKHLPPAFHPRLQELLSRLPARGPWRDEIRQMRAHWQQRKQKWQAACSASNATHRRYCSEDDPFGFVSRPLLGRGSSQLSGDVLFVQYSWLPSQDQYDDDRFKVLDEYRNETTGLETLDGEKWNVFDPEDPETLERAKMLVWAGAIEGLAVGMKSATLLDALHSLPGLKCLANSVAIEKQSYTGYDKATGERIILGVSENQLSRACNKVREGESIVSSILALGNLSTAPGAGFFGGSAQSDIDIFRQVAWLGDRSLAAPNAAGTANPLTGGGSIDGFYHAIQERREQQAREVLTLGAAGNLRGSAVASLFAHRPCDILDSRRGRYALELLLDDAEALYKNVELHPGLVSNLAQMTQRCHLAGKKNRDPMIQGMMAYLNDALSFIWPEHKHRFIDFGEQDMHKDEDDDQTLVTWMGSFFKVKSFEHCAVNQLDAKGVGQLLAAKSWLVDEKNAVPGDLTNQTGAMTKNEILHFVDVGTEHLVEQLGRLLESRDNRQTILNRVAEFHSLDKEYQWLDSGMGFPYFETKEDPSININVVTGKFEKGGIEGKFETPLELKDNAFFKTLFEGAMPKKLTKRSDHITYEHETEDKIKYIFVADKRTKRFSGDEKKDEVKREFDDVECLASWIDKHTFKTLPVSLEGCIAWTCENNVAVHVTSPSGMELLHLKKIEKSWRASAPWNAKLELVDVNLESNKPIVKLFQRIENLKHMFIFARAATSDAMSAVEGVWLPRLGLNFSGSELVDSNLNKFGVCGPTAFNNAKGDSSLLAHYLGDFDRYLPLCKGENKEFRAGALLPSAEFLKQEKALKSRLLTPTDGSAFLSAPKNCHTHTLGCIKFYYYEMPRGDDKITTLKPIFTSNEELVLGHAYLSTVMLSEGRYNASHRHLYLLDRQLKVRRESKVSEMQALKRIAEFAELNADYTPNAASVRLFAHASIRREVGSSFAYPFGPLWPKCTALMDDQGLWDDGSPKVSVDGPESKDCRNISPDGWWERNLVNNSLSGRYFETPAFPEEEFRIYRKYQNRVNSDLRLSDERYRLLNEWAGKLQLEDAHRKPLSGVLSPPNVSLHALRESQIKRSISMEEIVIDKWISTEVPSEDIVNYGKETNIHALTIPAPRSAKEVLQTALQPRPIFLRAFPEALLPMRALLKDPTDVRSSDVRAISAQLGLFTNIRNGTLLSNGVDIIDAMTTFFELRARQVAAAVRDDVVEIDGIDGTGVKEWGTAEVQTLAMLINAGRAGHAKYPVETAATEVVEAWAQFDHMRFTHVYDVRKEPFVRHLDAKQQENDIKNAIREQWEKNWRLWTTKEKSASLELTVPRADTREFSPVGSLSIETMNNFEDASWNHAESKKNNDLSFISHLKEAMDVRGEKLTLSKAVEILCEEYEYKAAKWSDASKNEDRIWIDGWIEGSPSIFKENHIESTSETLTSPFSEAATHSKDSFLRDTFIVYNEDFKKYDRDQVEQAQFSPGAEKYLQSVDDALRKRNEATEKCLKDLEDEQNTLLNERSSDSVLAKHSDIRAERGTQHELGPADANRALLLLQSRSELDASEHLQKLNLALTNTSQIRGIMKKRLDILLVKREKQRLRRALKALKEVQDHKDDPSTQTSSDVEYQKKMRDFKYQLSEKLQYNPIQEPLMLIIEVEFNIGFRPEQVPAIRKLAPKKRAACLYELAMGMGKTDVISPAVVSLLADGSTLPILVMPEALVPSMATRLQDRMEEAVKREVRVIPIDRVKHSAVEITALQKEMEIMKENAVPLVWSTNDIQTLINAFVEDMEDFRSRKLSEEEGERIVVAWQSLYTFMRKHTEIIGDEIHAILDILTTYNFALGDDTMLHVDEMDAVEDFLLLVSCMTREMSRSDTGEKVVAELKVTSKKTCDGDAQNMTDGELNNGKPFQITNEKFFNEHVKPYLIDHIMSRGIVRNQHRSEICTPDIKEFWNALTDSDQTVEDSIKGYLNSESTVSQDDIDTHIKRITNVKKKEELLPDHRRKANLVPYAGDWKMEQELVKECRKEYEIYGKRLKNFLAVQKESFRALFLLAAKQQVNKHYARSPIEEHCVVPVGISPPKPCVCGGCGVIPADNGRPQNTSLFGSTLERLYYTALVFIEEGIPINVVEAHVREIEFQYSKKAVLEGSVQGDCEDVGTIILQNQWINYFGTNTTVSARPKTTRQIEEIRRDVDSDILLQIKMIRRYMFEDIKFYKDEVESSTHILPLIVRGAGTGEGLRGMSGTIFNSDTFPTVFHDQTLSDTTADVMRRLKQVAPSVSVTLDISDVESWNNESYVLDKLGQVTQFGSDGQPPENIIDTTGYIDFLRAEEFAKQMHIKSGAKNMGKMVAFFDHSGALMVVTADGTRRPYDKDLDERDSVTAFWDLPHTTGSDIRISFLGEAAMIVGRHAKLYEISQSAMRLRQLGKGEQRLEVVIPIEDRDIMAHALKEKLGIEVCEGCALHIDHILSYALLNEVLQEMDNNYRAIDMRMRMAVMKPVLQKMWSKNTSAREAKEIFKSARTLFIKTTDPEPWEAYGTPVYKQNIEHALQNKEEEWKARLDGFDLAKFFGNDKFFNKNAIGTEFKKIVAERPKRMTAEVDSASMHGSKQSVEMQVKTQQQIKMQTQQQVKMQIQTIQNKEARALRRDPIGLHLRREPYPAADELKWPSVDQIFEPAEHQAVPLASILGVPSDRISACCVSAKDILRQDPDLKNALKMNGLWEQISGLRFSLNLAPLWGHHRTIPLYAPFGFFQKAVAGALAVHDGNKITLTLLDMSDMLQLSETLKQARDLREKTKRLQQKSVKEEVLLMALFDLHFSPARLLATDDISVKTERELKENLGNNDDKVELENLLTVGKLLSGEIRFAESENACLTRLFLSHQPRGRSFDDKAISSLVDALVRRLARHQERTKQSFRSFMVQSNTTNRNIGNDLWNVLTNFSGASDPLSLFQVTNTSLTKDERAGEAVRKVLLDLTLPVDRRTEKISVVEHLVPVGGKDFNNEKLWLDWVPTLVPLLPLEMFQVEYQHAGASRSTPQAKLRRTVMQAAFKTLASEYHGWRTAVPSMEASADCRNKKQCSILSPLLALSTTAARRGNKHVADEAQLEVMAELSHAAFGLPQLRSSKDATEFARNAIESIDLTRSLHHLDALDGYGSEKNEYQFERLYGLFDFAAFMEDGAFEKEARTRYGLNLLPRLFGDLLDERAEREIRQEELLWFAEQIGSKFIVTGAPAGMITWALKRSSKRSMTAFPERSNVGISSGSDKIDAWWKLSSLALRGLTVNADVITANITSSLWLKSQLAFAPTRHWFVDGVVYQLLKRHAIDNNATALVDHIPLGRYFNLPPQKEKAVSFPFLGTAGMKKNSVMADHFKEILKYSKLKQYTEEERAVVFNLWEVDFFDLATEVLDLPTRHRPIFNTPQIAHAMTVVLKYLVQIPSHKFSVTDGEQKLFKRIISFNTIDKTMLKRPLTDAKVALDKLVTESDKISSRSRWEDFLGLQKTLEPIRLAGRFTTDGPKGLCDSEKCEMQRQLEALQHFPRLYGADSGLTKVVLTLLLRSPGQLMRYAQDENVVTGKHVYETLENMLDALPWPSLRSIRDPNDKDRWTTTPQWWDMARLSAPFTFNGSKAQVIESFKWLNEKLIATDIHKNMPNWMLDGQIMMALEKDVSQINHEPFVRYGSGMRNEEHYKQKEFLSDLFVKSHVGRWFDADPKAYKRCHSALIDLLPSNKFELFVDLIDLGTRGRVPMSSSLLAGELGDLVGIAAKKQLLKETAHFSIFRYGLDNVVARAAASRDLSNTTTMIKKFEATLEQHISFNQASNIRAEADTIIEALNFARDISDYHPTVFDARTKIVSAYKELFDLDTAKGSNLRKRIFCCYHRPELSFLPKLLESLLPQLSAESTPWVADAVKTSVRSVLNGGRETNRLDASSPAPSEAELINKLLFPVSNKNGQVADAFMGQESLDVAREFQTTVNSMLEEFSKNTVKASWLLDEYVIRVAKVDETKLEHVFLTKYGYSRKGTGKNKQKNEFVEDLLRRKYNFKSIRINEKVYYSGGHRDLNLDVLFELVPLKTKNQVEVQGATLTTLLRKQIRRDSFENQNEREILTKLLDMIETRWLSGTESEEIGDAFLRTTDTHLFNTNCASSGKRCYIKFSSINSRINDIRMKITFFNHSPSANLLRAIDQLLNVNSSTFDDNQQVSARLHLYADNFVQERLVAALPENDDGSSWVAKALLTAANSNWARLHASKHCLGDHDCLSNGEAQKIINLLVDKIFLPHQSKRFAQELTRILGSSADPTITTRPRSWLLDWLTVRAVNDVKFEVGSAALKQYDGAALHLLPRLLEDSLKDKVSQRLVIKYAKTFDVAVYLGRIPTKDPVSVQADEIADSITAELKMAPVLSTGAEVKFVTEIVTDIRQKGAKPNSKSLQALLHALDETIVKTREASVDVSKLINAVDDMRIVVEYDSGSDAEKVVKAMTEILEQNCSAYRRTLYYAFVRDKLVRGDTSYIKGVLAAVESSTWVETEDNHGKDHSMVKLLVDDLMMKNPDSYASELTAVIGSIGKAQWLIEEIIIRAVSEMPGNIGHAELKAYSRLLSAKKRQKFMKALLYAAKPKASKERLLAEKYASSNFDLIIDFGEIQTKVPYNHNAKELSDALSAKINADEIVRDAEELEWLRKWVQKVQKRDAFESSFKKDSGVGALLARLDAVLVGLGKGLDGKTLGPRRANHKAVTGKDVTEFENTVHSIRFASELNASSLVNLRTALQHLDSGDNTRRYIYLQLIKDGVRGISQPALLPAAKDSGAKGTEWIDAVIEKCTDWLHSDDRRTLGMHMVQNLTFDILDVQKDSPAIEKLQNWLIPNIRDGKNPYHVLFFDLVARRYVPFKVMKELFDKMEYIDEDKLVDELRKIGQTRCSSSWLSKSTTLNCRTPPMKQVYEQSDTIIDALRNGAKEAISFESDLFGVISSLFDFEMRDFTPMDATKIIGFLNKDWVALESTQCRKLPGVLDLLEDLTKRSDSKKEAVQLLAPLIRKFHEGPCCDKNQNEKEAKKKPYLCFQDTADSGKALQELSALLLSSSSPLMKVIYVGVAIAVLGGAFYALTPIISGATTGASTTAS